MLNHVILTGIVGLWIALLATIYHRPLLQKPSEKADEAPRGEAQQDVVDDGARLAEGVSIVGDAGDH